MLRIRCYNNLTKGYMMQLIFIVILGAVLGFAYGLENYGFVFSSKICLFAGITLIMPSLFKFKLRDIKLVWLHKNILIKGFLVNFIALPLIAIGVGLLTHDFGIAMGLFLISTLSGGGMVMHWIKKSGGDTSFGFLLLFINLVSISLSLLMLHNLALYSAEYFEASYGVEHNMSRYANIVLILLILIPFVVSRFVILVQPIVDLIEKYRKYISNVSIFVILFYLFGLQSSQNLVDLYDFEPELFGYAFVAVVAFYAGVTTVSFLAYDLKSPQQIATFWHSITRYLTLGLVISSFSLNTFGVSMLLPIMFAYLIQIPLSTYLDSRFFNKSDLS